MKGLTFVFFTISAMSFLASFYFFISLKRPGFYPPKNLLKKRAAAMASGGVVFILLGLLFSLF